MTNKLIIKEHKRAMADSMKKYLLAVLTDLWLLRLTLRVYKIFGFCKFCNMHMYKISYLDQGTVQVQVMRLNDSSDDSDRLHENVSGTSVTTLRDETVHDRGLVRF